MNTIRNHRTSRNGSCELAAAIFATSLCCFSQTATGQCVEQWFATDGVSGGTPPAVFAIKPWDPDGTGPLSHVQAIGGQFAAAGSTTATNVALWDGTSFSALGEGTNGRVNALAVLPTGELVAGGSFSMAGGVVVNNIARWDGVAWNALDIGMNNEVTDLAIMPNGDLVAGGFFTTAGAGNANRVARWNGAAWSSLGTGVGGSVYAVLVMPNGDVVVGGTFTTAGGSTALRVARWNGATWTGIGGMTGGANVGVFSLCLMPNGDIVAGGNFTFPGSRVSRWNGTTWTGLGTGVNNAVWALTALESGDLIVGGSFISPSFAIARWDGAAWSGLGTGLAGGNVQAFEVRPNSDLLVGGAFTTAGSFASPGLARWAIPVPIISQQPMSTATCASGSAMFSVIPDGAGPFTFAWEAELDPSIWTPVEDGVLLHGAIILGTVNGASTSVLTIDGLTHFPEDRNSLNLRCNLIDSCGSTTSDTALLTAWQIATGDANGDGLCNGGDVPVFADAVVHGGVPSAGLCACDFNADGVVTAADVDGLISHMLVQ